MTSRLNDVPAFQIMPAAVEAVHYNRVRVALARLGAPLRLSIGPLRGLDMLLDRDDWVCVDRTLDDLPVVAWVGFAAATRAALHAPVPCELRYFHAHAGIIVRTLLAEVDREIDQRLAHAYADAPHTITSLPPHTA